MDAFGASDPFSAAFPTNKTNVSFCVYCRFPKVQCNTFHSSRTTSRIPSPPSTPTPPPPNLTPSMTPSLPPTIIKRTINSRPPQKKKIRSAATPSPSCTRQPVLHPDAPPVPVQRCRRRRASSHLQDPLRRDLRHRRRQHFRLRRSRIRLVMIRLLRRRVEEEGLLISQILMRR